jgi:hypothetical protein
MSRFGRKLSLCLLLLQLSGLACPVLAQSEIPNTDQSPNATATPSGSGEKIPLAPAHILDSVTEVSQPAPAPAPTPSDSAARADPVSEAFETTLFDIYLGDKFKGAILADFTESWIRITEPTEVISQLKDLKGGERLVPLLTGIIEKQRSVPDIATVTYDLNAFRIIIQPSENLLGTSAIQLTRRVSPDPDSGFSLQQRLGATGSGDTSTDMRTAFNHRSIASYGEFFGVIDGAAVSDRDYEVTEGSAGGIFGDYRGRGGLLQTSGGQFAPSLQHLGVSFETAEELFLDQDLIRGSKFEVFIPSRSKVEFYRDGRLLAVQVLDFGLQEINTAGFPQGSYDVDIIITDNFGVVTRQRKFFTKSGYLASRARPIYSLHIGSIRDNLNSLDIPVYQTGLRWRAADIFDVSASVYGSEDLHIGSVGSNLLFRDYRLGVESSFSNDGDFGASSSMGGRILGVNFDLGVTKTFVGGEPPPVLPTPDPDDPFSPVFALQDRRDKLTFEDRDELNGNIYREFGPVTLRIAGERTRNSRTDDRYAVGPVVEWRIREGADSNLKLQLAYAHTESGDIYNSGLTYGYRLTRALQLSSQVGLRRNDKDNEGIVLVSLSYDTKERDGRGTRAKLNSELQNSQDDENRSIISQSNQLDFDHTGGYLQTLGFIRQDTTSEASNTAIGASAISSFLVSGDGGVDISHPVSEEAVLVAELPSESTDTEFQVLINGQIAATVKAGEKAVIGVAPYRAYDVSIRPTEGAELVTYDSSVTKMTFFPGNVRKKRWGIEKIFIILGRLVDQNGAPLARQRIKGTKDYTATEQDGTFQAEVGGSESLFVESQVYRCKLDLNITERPEYFVDLGDVRCISETANR